MVWILKHKNKKGKAILGALFLAAFFLFTRDALATPAAGGFTAPTTTSNGFSPPASQQGNINGGRSGSSVLDTYRNGGDGGGITGYQTNGTNIETTCTAGGLTNPGPAIACVFKMLLVGVMAFFGWILAAAVVLFGWVVNPNTISGETGVLNQPAIVEIWTNVRDFLNMFFIMILLFSAFCTIFQVDKWNLKKVWLSIVINALLVNFSFTIARFFIDVSNVTMYYILNSMFPSVSGDGSSILAAISNGSGLDAIIHPQGDISNTPWTFLIASIVFIFILAITLLVLAVMFVIRLCVLAIIVMFSPVGFVGYIFPKLHEYADDWWKNLFKYSFFAPIMVFMLAVAIRIMNAMGNHNIQGFLNSANGQTTGAPEASVIANMAFFIIPILILWIGMGISQKLGVEGANAVVGQGKGFAKWAGNTAWKATRVPGTAKKVSDEFGKKGKLFGVHIPLMGSESREKQEARWSAGVTDGKMGYKDTARDQLRAEASEKRKKWKDAGGASSDELSKALQGKNKAIQMAAAMEMAENNGFAKLDANGRPIPGTDLVNYQNSLRSLENDPVLKNAFNDKVKEKHIKMVIDTEFNEANAAKMAHTGSGLNAAEKSAIYAKHLDKMSAEKIANQKGIHGDTGLHEYLKDQVSKNPKNARVITKAAEKLSQEDRGKWKTGGVPI